MSVEAYGHLAENLATVTRATFTDTGKKSGTRAIGQDGLALLVYLCNECQMKTGHRFFMTAETMKQETGIATIRTVRTLLAGFEELGWITRTGQVVSYKGRGKPTPEYVLTFVPGVTVNAQNDATGAPLGAPGDTRKSEKPNTEKENTISRGLETQTQPQTQDARGVELVGEDKETLDECLKIEQENTKTVIGIGLRITLTGIYTKLIKGHPDYFPQELYDLRQSLRPGNTITPTTVKNEPPRNCAPDCPQCNGQGYYLTDPTGNSKTTKYCDYQTEQRRKLKAVIGGLLPQVTNSPD